MFIKSAFITLSTSLIFTKFFPYCQSKGKGLGEGYYPATNFVNTGRGLSFGL